MELGVHSRAVLQPAEGEIQIEACDDRKADHALLEFGVRAGTDPLPQASGKSGKRQLLEHAMNQQGVSPRSRMMAATESMRRSKAPTQAGSKCLPLSALR